MMCHKCGAVAPVHLIKCEKCLRFFCGLHRRHNCQPSCYECDAMLPVYLVKCEKCDKLFCGLHHKHIYDHISTERILSEHASGHLDTNELSELDLSIWHSIWFTGRMSPMILQTLQDWCFYFKFVHYEIKKSGLDEKIAYHPLLWVNDIFLATYVGGRPDDSLIRIPLKTLTSLPIMVINTIKYLRLKGLKPSDIGIVEFRRPKYKNERIIFPYVDVTGKSVFKFFKNELGNLISTNLYRLMALDIRTFPQISSDIVRLMALFFSCGGVYFDVGDMPPNWKTFGKKDELLHSKNIPYSRTQDNLNSFGITTYCFFVESYGLAAENSIIFTELSNHTALNNIRDILNHISRNNRFIPAVIKIRESFVNKLMLELNISLDDANKLSDSLMQKVDKFKESLSFQVGGKTKLNAAAVSKHGKNLWERDLEFLNESNYQLIPESEMTDQKNYVTLLHDAISESVNDSGYEYFVQILNQVNTMDLINCWHRVSKFFIIAATDLLTFANNYGF